MPLQGIEGVGSDDELSGPRLTRRPYSVLSKDNERGAEDVGLIGDCCR